MIVDAVCAVLGAEAVAEEASADGALFVVCTAPEEALILADVQDGLCVAHRAFHIMRHHDDCDAVLVMDVPQDAVKLRGDKRVETRERLIEQEQLFGRAERPCEQDALLLSAGELPVAAVGKRRDVQACHLFVGACLVRLCVKGMDRVPVQAAREHDFPHRCREAALDLALLREIADLIAF